MKISIFEYEDYQEYLTNVLVTSGERRGMRSKLARQIGCQPAFVSQVLLKKGHFSNEHAIESAKFLELSEEETDYFLLLVQYQRAGTTSLRNFLQKKIRKIQESQKNIKSRIKVDKMIGSENQAEYYSSWHYAAIHIATSIPHFSTPEAIAKQLSIPLNRVINCLEFLVSCGLVLQKNQKYLIGETRIHLGANSNLIAKHHSNWRIRAINQLDSFQSSNTHYSLVMSLSEKDVERIREELIQCIQRCESIIQESPEEKLYCVGLDFFQIK